jgi:hypothetical protein
MAMNTNIYPFDGSNLPQYGVVTHYQDKGIDAQYQYLLDPHTVTAQLRYITEKINDDTGTNANSNRLNSFFAKITYVFRNEYGADVAYRSVNGSSDIGAYQNYATTQASSYSTSLSNSPNSKLWTPEVFWLPMQNLRLGLQYNMFTQYLGATSNYDGNNRNASDNNFAYLYAWLAF